MTRPARSSSSSNRSLSRCQTCCRRERRFVSEEFMSMLITENTLPTPAPTADAIIVACSSVISILATRKGTSSARSADEPKGNNRRVIPCFVSLDVSGKILGRKPANDHQPAESPMATPAIETSASRPVREKRPSKRFIIRKGTLACVLSRLT